MHSNTNSSPAPAPDLYKIILELTERINKLEEKVNTIICKPNYLLWLSTNISVKSSISFSDLHSLINITDNDIDEIILNNDITFYKFLEKIFKREICSTHPIYCLNKSIYVYEIIDQSGSGSFFELTSEKLVYFMNIIHKKIVSLLFSWRREKLPKDDPNLTDLYNKCMKKMMSIEFKGNTYALSKIRSILVKIEDINYQI